MFKSIELKENNCYNVLNKHTYEKICIYYIKSFKDYPELRLDEDNVVVLCRICNLQVGDSSMVDEGEIYE